MAESRSEKQNNSRFDTDAYASFRAADKAHRIVPSNRQPRRGAIPVCTKQTVSAIEAPHPASHPPMS